MSLGMHKLLAHLLVLKSLPYIFIDPFIYLQLDGLCYTIYFILLICYLFKSTKILFQVS